MAPACASCGQVLQAPAAGPVCEPCWHSIGPFTPPVCDACGGPLPSIRGLSGPDGVTVTSRAQAARRPRCPSCRRGSRPVERARAIGPYEGRLRDIIHAFKYEGRRSLARPLGALLRAHGADVLCGADVAVPVPLHWRRRHARGFNQAALLARELGLPVRHALRRRRPTRPQVELAAADRHTNVTGAFALKWRCRRGVCSPSWGFGSSGARPLSGAIVVLVDDVSTTGATLDACARVLLAAGVAEVRALTAARVASPRR
jgi:predicted amidophosphoribosyltransferase